MKIWRRVSLILFAIIFVACSGDEGVESSNDKFDRQAMLENWTDNIIVPGYKKYVSDVEDLKSTTTSFIDQPSMQNLTDLREAWLKAYRTWQKVAMFEIGKAEELTLINYTNIYPLDVEAMTQTIESGNYDLNSVDKQDEQGFPAIEYLIYGIRDTDQSIVDFYLEETANQLYQTYLENLASRLETMGNVVLSDWESGYRDTFVREDGSDATSSVNKFVNDYIFYYEKHLRAGKIGIPAGVFSGSKLPEKVEGRFSGKSKELFETSVNSMQDFFNGKHFESNLNVEEESLRSYLDYLNTIKEGDDLGALINDQFDLVRQAASSLSQNFEGQVENNNRQMLAVYDALQVNVILLKVDMAQAMSIGISYVDADSD